MFQFNPAGQVACTKQRHTCTRAQQHGKQSQVTRWVFIEAGVYRLHCFPLITCDSRGCPIVSGYRASINNPLFSYVNERQFGTRTRGAVGVLAQKSFLVALWIFLFLDPIRVSVPPGGSSRRGIRRFAAIDYGQPIIPIMVDDAYFFPPSFRYARDEGGTFDSGAICVPIKMA